MDQKCNIYDILLPLDRYLTDVYDLEWHEWENMQDVALRLLPGKQNDEIRAVMKHFYEMYLFGDEALYSIRKHTALEFVAFASSIDPAFADYVAEVDMVKLTNMWICNGSVNGYLFLLERLTEVDYEADWGSMYDEVNRHLMELEVCGESSSGEYYCILHGFLMIMTASQNYLERQTRFKLFRQHWKFLCHLYSVMVRRIVGMGFSNFVSVVNNARNSGECIPYLKLFYSALIERYEELCRLGSTKQKKLDTAISKVSEVISTNEQSDELDALCEVLFPEEIREMLNTHRLPTYEQLRDENLQLRQQQQELRKKIQEQTRQANDTIAQLTEALKAGVEAAIPVEYIEQELMELPINTAWDIFQTLNELLQDHDVWRKYDRSIRAKLKEKMTRHELNQNRATVLMEKVATTPQSVTVNGTVVMNNETNIDKNYGPNIDNHDGGTLSLPERIIDNKGN